MKRKLIHLSVHQTSKVVAAMIFLIAAFFCIPAAFWLYFTSSDPNVLLLILAPILYAAAVYLTSLVYVTAYNIALKWCGGIEYTSEDSQKIDPLPEKIHVVD